MKYLLINQETGEKTLCDKVTIDGFDYYVSNGQPNINDFSFNTKYEWIKEVDKNYLLFVNYEDKKVIATTNPNIDIPQVVDDEEIVNYSESLAKSLYNTEAHRNESIKSLLSVACQSGYNKSQETHPFSEEDMIEFAKWLDDNMQQREYYPMSSMNHKELLQLWKSQQPKKVYYEK